MDKPLLALLTRLCCSILARNDFCDTTWERILAIVDGPGDVGAMLRDLIIGLSQKLPASSYSIGLLLSRLSRVPVLLSSVSFLEKSSAMIELLMLVELPTELRSGLSWCRLRNA